MSPSPASSSRAPLELWVRLTFALALATVVYVLLLGVESPAPWHRRTYRSGPILLGLAGALLLALGLFTSVRRRPFLQRGRVVAMLLAGGCLLLGGCPVPYPSPYAERVSPIAFAFPLEGEWTVRFGGEEPFWNPLRFQPDRRFGFEFWRVDAEGQPDRGASVGQPVFAPASGRLVGIHALGEARGTADGGENRDPRVEIVLDLGDGSYLFLRGLERGSLAIQEGQRVERVERIGVLGQPGRPQEPASLGMHLQDTPRPGDGVGMPLSFDHLLIEGQPRERVVPAGGLRQGTGAAGWKVAADRPG